MGEHSLDRDLAREAKLSDDLGLEDFGHSALPEPSPREAFVLQQEGGLSVEEIAAATGVNRETAKSRLRYALAKLRAALADLRQEHGA